MVADAGGARDTRCALAVGLSYERAFAATMDANGATAVYFDAHRASAEIDSERLVPKSVRDKLQGCPSIKVFAPAPVHGTPSLLPPDLAWSYRFGGDARADQGRAPPHRVLVSDVEPPASLGLPKLLPWKSAPGADAPSAWLRGTTATPDRVLAELRDATEVEIHAHGLVDLAVSDASLIALSPDESGRYALTAGAIRATRMNARPVVVLAACRAARVAPFDHEPWSLPLAFIKSGARAVLASPSPIRDADAAAFFDAVLTRIRAGASPAAALRDERLAWLSRGANPWVREVLLFDSASADANSPSSKP
jgi:hypothetical protein